MIKKNPALIAEKLQNNMNRDAEILQTSTVSN
jgi:hypothetical protein